MDSSPAKILLVDDHQDTLDLFALVLTQAGNQVTPATTVDSALKLVRERSFDLLILDTRIVDGSGIELCRLLRRDGNLTPVLFCSGMALEKNKRDALNAGAQGYLVKPVSVSVLCEAAAKLISEFRKQPYKVADDVKRKTSGDLTASAF